MKTYIFLFALLFSCSFLTTAQQSIPFSDIEELYIKGNLEVTLTPGTESAVIVEAGESDKVKIIQEGDELTVRHKDLFRYKSYREFPIKVEIVYQDLDFISIAAGAQVRSAESVAGLRVDFKLRSGARAWLDLQTAKSDVDVAEGAIALMTGRVGQFTGIAATGGQLEAQELISERCKIRANTGGTARVVAKEYLDAQAHTGGTVIYGGSPLEVTTDDILGGTICKRS